MKQRFGELTPIRTRRGVLMLVAQARQTKSGRFTRLSTRRSRDGGEVVSLANRAMVPLFWIVPEVRLGKRLSWPEIARQAEAGFGRRVESNLKRRLEGASATPAVAGDVPSGWD